MLVNVLCTVRGVALVGFPRHCIPWSPVGATNTLMIRFETIGVTRLMKESVLHDAHCESAMFVTKMYSRVVHYLRDVLPGIHFWRAMTVPCYQRDTSAEQSTIML